jgi:hypothetical protein
MAKEKKYGGMEIDIRAIGSMIKERARAPLCGAMETGIQDSGKIITLLASEQLLILKSF